MAKPTTKPKTKVKATTSVTILKQKHGHFAKAIKTTKRIKKTDLFYPRITCIPTNNNINIRPNVVV